MLTLGAYARYVQNQSRIKDQESGGSPAFRAITSRPWPPDYGIDLAVSPCGLLSKNDGGDAPFVLLSLDYWPFNRLSRNRHPERPGTGKAGG